MGQHSVLQREGLSGVGLEIALTYHIVSDPRSGYRGVVTVPKLWLDERGYGRGVYLVSVTDGRSVVRFFAEYRPGSSDVSWWYRRVPREFALVFEDRSRVWLTLQRIDVFGFFELVRERIMKKFGFGELGVVGGSVVFRVSGKELSFPIVEFGCQVHMRHSGAFVTFSSSGREEDALKIFYAGHGEPDLSLLPRGDAYRPVDTISYEYGGLRVQYRHGKLRPQLRSG